LVPKRAFEPSAPNSYFDETEVIEEFKGNRRGHSQLLSKVFSKLTGQFVLEGHSGLGKTMLLQKLAENSKEIVVFLKATDCTKGVVPAIQKKLQGQAKDAAYLSTLIHVGALDLLIDGLNEASPETRSRISQFFEEHYKGNCVLTTQQLSGWIPPETASVYEIQPLKLDQIGKFLIKQWPSLKAKSKLTDEGYLHAVSQYLADFPNVKNLADPLRIPMEARLAAELLAEGERPDAFRLVEQRFENMARDFKQKNGRDFPLTVFSQRVYDWRKSDEDEVDMKGFELEAEELVTHRLMIQRSDLIQLSEGSVERTRWFFRHDRIMEYFLLPAFSGSKHRNRRIENVEDIRFWGVYELLATRLDIHEEAELYAWLNEFAADKNSNDLRNRYEIARRLRSGAKGIPEAAQHEGNAVKSGTTFV
jgi:hypothetical protein